MEVGRLMLQARLEFSGGGRLKVKESRDYNDEHYSLLVDGERLLKMHWKMLLELFARYSRNLKAGD
jgi:hypothetical protein